MVNDRGLSATGYLLSQEALEVAPEEFSYGAYKTFQVSVAKIQELTRTLLWRWVPARNTLR